MMGESNGFNVISNLNYCEPVEGQMYAKRNKLNSSMWITSKTCLDLFLPTSSSMPLFHSNGKTSSTTSISHYVQENTPINKGESVKGSAKFRHGGDTVRFRGIPEVDDRNDDIVPATAATDERVSVECDPEADEHVSCQILNSKSSSGHDRWEPTATHRSNGHHQVSYQGQQHGVCEDGRIGKGSIGPPRETTTTEVKGGTSASPHPRPLVVFAYGGGWRRGDKQTWKHYLSRWDINLLLYASVWKRRLYRNIGESLAGQAGFPCAILSYPLVPTPFPINIFEIFTSFLFTILFVFASLAVLGMVCEVVFFLLSFGSLLCIAWSALRQCSEIPALTILGAIVSLAQLLTLVIIVFRERYLEKHQLTEPKIKPVIQKSWLLKSNTIIMVVGLFFIATLVANNYNSLHNDLATTMILPGILVAYVQYLNYRYQQMTMFQRQPSTSGQSTLTSDLVAGPEGQARSIVQALRWLVDYGKLTGHFDPHSIILMGYSAGGHLVSLITLDHHYLSEVGLCPEVIKGVITLSAVHDLGTISTGLPYHVYLKPAFGTNPAYWKQMSPLAHVQGHLKSIRERTDRGRDERAEIIRYAHPYSKSSQCARTSKSSQCAKTSERSEYPQLSSAESDSECARSPNRSDDSVLTSDRFDSTARNREYIECAKLSKHRRTDFKPPFLIISAEKDMEFMTHDAERMYRALLASGYDARRGRFAGCNHFTMAEQFGVGRSGHISGNEIAPSDAERLCWDFVEGIRINLDKEDNRNSSQ